MKFIFHGGASEVGRSCIEIRTGEDQYLFDAGIKFTDRGYDYPEKVFELHKIDGLFLSHAHLDHSGALPMFENRNLICPLFCTEETYELTKILLKDSYKIAHIRHIDPAYEKIDLKKVSRATRIVQFGKRYNHNSVSFQFFNAGHIPGSASVLFKAEGKTVVYSGDINFETTELMEGADVNYGPVDVLICESTYGGVDRESREGVKKKFLDRIEKVVREGGSVLIPTFALGRAQEIIIMLNERKFKVPIYFDGMCVKVTKHILGSTGAFLNKEKQLREGLRKVRTVHSEKRRNQIATGKGIFVATSGMLQGGPVIHYLKHMWHNPKNAILLAGFQTEGSNGRHLIEAHYAYIKGWKTYVQCQVEKFDFSGHSDGLHLQEYVKKVNPKLLILNHGDPEHIKALAEWARKNTSCKVVVPKVGDEMDF